MSARRPPIVLTDEAQDDLLSIALYGVLNWGEEQADRYHAGIADALELVRHFPRIGREVSGFGAGVRTIGYGQHRILYRPELDTILVLRVLHERMDAAPDQTT